MRFSEAPIPGVYVIEPELVIDDRGHFARTYSAQEFAARGLGFGAVESSLSYNAKRGTLRGMHFQRPPHAECKLVRCTRGSIFDVVVDLRAESFTYRDWFGVELSAESARSLYLPEGCAHGFITVEDSSEVHYQISHPYTPSHADGVRWDDPSLGIVWPLEPTVISQRDRSFPKLVS